MNYINNIKKFTLLILLLFQFAFVCFAQTTKLPEPRQEKLLNGLKLLAWNEPNAEKVTVKLRIHSGSAFDPQGKEGVMALLADALFPNEAQREFFAEDLGGSLEVTSNFDFIQINATGNSEQFLTIVETLATAVTNPQINKEITSKIVAARLEKVKELEKNPAYIADQAVAKRLFGDFPYGRAQNGTSASLAKIDFADLLFAKQRFLTADNATLAISGNVKHDLAFRAVRRYFGAWEKADKKIPATFRQPDAPDARTPTIEIPIAEKYSLRIATMVAARNDKDFYATQVLTRIRQNQLCHNTDAKHASTRLETYLLYGIYVVSINNLYNNETPPTGKNPCLLFLSRESEIIYSPITQNDFDTAKSQLNAEVQQKIQSFGKWTELWLDVDTFKLTSVKDEIAKLSNVALSDVEQVAANWQKLPTARVFVKNPEVSKH